MHMGVCSASEGRALLPSGAMKTVPAPSPPRTWDSLLAGPPLAQPERGESQGWSAQRGRPWVRSVAAAPRCWQQQLLSLRGNTFLGRRNRPNKNS